LITSLAKSPEKVGFTRDCVPEWPNLLFTNRRYSTGTGNNVRDDYMKIVTSWFNEPIPQKIPPQLLRITDEEKKKIEELSSAGQYKLLVCPGSAWSNKRVSTKTLKELLQKIESHQPCHIYLAWGSNEEKAAVEELAQSCKAATILPRVSLPVLQNFM